MLNLIPAPPACAAKDRDNTNALPFSYIAHKTGFGRPRPASLAVNFLIPVAEQDPVMALQFDLPAGRRINSLVSLVDHRPEKIISQRRAHY